MVSRKLKNEATQFICDTLEDSGNYNIQKRDEKSIVLAEKPTIYEFPKAIEVIVPNFLTPIRNFQEKFRENTFNSIYTAPIFYKDGTSAFVRLAERESWRGDKSLKNYTPQQINQMLSLRKIEKKVMGNFGDELNYYQPETERLNESLKTFKLLPVNLDYSHISPSEQAYNFVKNRTSIDYKLPRDVDTILPAGEFSYFKQEFKAIIVSTPLDQKQQMIDEFHQIAQDAFSDLELEDAIKAYNGEPF